MIRAASAYLPPARGTQERPTTPLWALAEQCAAVTGTRPNRWLRYGEVTLRLALAHLGEKGDVKKRAAFLVWSIKFHHAQEVSQD